MAPLASLPIRYPSPTYLILAPALALGALPPSPSLPPLILLLATLRLHASATIPRHNWSSIGSQFLLISLVVAIVHAGSSLRALSTPLTSLVVLACISAVTTAIAGGAIVTGYYLERADPTSFAHAIMFPATWATVWAVVEYGSPIGQLATWSPVAQLGGYAWLRQIGGQVAINWVVAAWAVVISYAAGAWMLGSSDDEEEEDVAPGVPDLVVFAEDNLQIAPVAPAAPDANEMNAARSYASSRTRTTLLLAGLLLILTVPSYVISDLPPRVAAPDATPFGVACALPYPMRNGKPQGPAGLDDYIAESRTLQSSANIVLWPESAIKFEGPNDREEAFEKIMNKTNRGVYYGVGFDELVHEDSPDGTWKVGMRRNGLVLLGSEGVVYEYYKRNLVPIAESFSMTPSNDRESIFTMQLGHPKTYTAPTWAPAPNFTRPINITASICLDFSTSWSFANLPSRPALILAPARTWHTSIGLAMWERAKARAEEQGSMVLWCDGGEGGVSGVAGRGMHAFRQVGPGSWTQTVSIPWPFDQHRTVFSATGTMVWVGIVWAIVFLVGGTGGVAGSVLNQLEARGGGAVGALGEMVRRMRVVVANLGRRERQGEEEPLLG